MSLTGTLKDLEAANKDLTARLAAMEADAAKAADGHVAALAALRAETAARIKELEGERVRATDLAGRLEASEKALAEVSARVKGLEGELEKARRALANPAFAEAAAAGQKTPPADGGEPEGRPTDEAFLAAYRAETNPEKRAAMWRKRIEG